MKNLAARWAVLGGLAALGVVLYSQTLTFFDYRVGYVAICNASDAATRSELIELKSKQENKREDTLMMSYLALGADIAAFVFVGAGTISFNRKRRNGTES